ncbi:MAG TPA: ribose 5-phosphate isomerase B [Candidatus Limenecus avicola]|mgnify:FL=1|uniref:Ribose 5-phosphate isomerase B n=1 Tax=Candidatus Limenecus avicola TaxID=2840847 RepID=A0A9D1MZB4_9CLOT|nr:ribose 5-phosphate isomerase B [Candidatus Limenecus avicola]
MNKKIIIGSDHAGFILKNKLAAYLQQSGFDVDDAGTYTTESCDYPVIAKEVAQNIKEGKYEKGILVCGTGIGMSIAANKVKGIRAAVVSDTCSAKMSRLHNDANILCLGERIVGEELAKDIAEIWLKTPFLGERHSRRVEMFEQD